MDADIRQHQHIKFMELPVVVTLTDRAIRRGGAGEVSPSFFSPKVKTNKCKMLKIKLISYPRGFRR